MKEKARINQNHISIMGGICFILFALVTLFSTNTPFSFLIKIITHSFGFVGFWILLPYIFLLGLYLILKKKVIKIRLGSQLWGIFIIIICFLILSSHWASWGAVINGVEIVGHGTTETGTAKYLTFSNAIPIFNQISATDLSTIGPSPKFGGGKVGFILAGALNSALTPIGLSIVCWILFGAGIIIIFNAQIQKFIKYLKLRKKVGKDNVFREVDLNMAELEPSEPIKVEEVKEEETPVFDNKPIFETFHTSSPINNDNELKKARFVLMDENANLTKEVTNEEMSKAVFEPQKPAFEDSFKNNEVEDSGGLSIENEEKEYSEPFFEPLKERENKQFESVQEKAPEPAVRIPEPTISTPEPEVEFVNRPQPKAKPLKNYIFPSIDLLEKNDTPLDENANAESIQTRIEIINRTLANLRIGAEVFSYTVGPSVTRYDLKTNDDVSINAVQRYVDDLAVRLGGISVRFEPIVAGKSTSGLEIPNEVRTKVTIREAVEGLPTDAKHKLDIPFGVSISGELKYASLPEFPLLLIAGTTGSGKSIFVHSTIISLLMRNRPEELKLIMVDPKKVEMNYYDDIPHLLCPVISDLRKVPVCFNKLVDEMERRYNLFKNNRVRDIKGFNIFAKEKGIEPLPYIVVFIDEYADLVETCKDIREPVVRIVQKARAAGIHMVFATQRPSVNVIDGVIKANVATRVALMCASATDSMTVIGSGGAESLLGNGDMLIDCPLLSRSIKPRVQGCYVSETEIMRVCEFLREHYQPQFDPMFLNLDPVVEEKKFEEVEVAPIDKEKSDEEVYQRIKDDAKHREYFSISYITRTYQMGFSRAGKIFTRLQKEGVVAPSGDARGCKVLIYSPYDSQVSSEEVSTLIPDDGTSGE